MGHWAAIALPWPKAFEGLPLIFGRFQTKTNVFTMNRPSLFKRVLLPSLAFMLVASLGVGCSGCNGTEADTNAAGDAGMTTDGADGSAIGHDANDGTDHTGHDHMNGSDHNATASDGLDAAGTTTTTDRWTRTYATPVEERTGTVENLNGLRATLVTELDQVRARLKDGTRATDDRKADSQRAAELAQGLERLDRTIKEINEATDVTWTQMRTSSLKSAGEFREWMTKYGMPS